MVTDNGWQEYKKLFEYIIKKVDKIDTTLDMAVTKIGKLEERSKLMSAFWGSMGGGVAILISIAMRFFSS